MNKIEQIEKLLTEWKARESQAKEKGWTGREYDASNIVFGIIRALEILKQPSNTQLHEDKEPCAECEKEKKNYPWPPFCKWCGRALHQ